MKSLKVVGIIFFSIFVAISAGSRVYNAMMEKEVDIEIGRWDDESTMVLSNEDITIKVSPGEFLSPEGEDLASKDYVDRQLEIMNNKWEETMAEISEEPDLDVDWSVVRGASHDTTN